MKNLEKIIDQVDGSMRMEGMPLTQMDKDRIRRCAGNDELVEKKVGELIKKHMTARAPDKDFKRV